MICKLIAVGPSKYIADRINWLDGFVVSLSIIEILLNTFTNKGSSISAFRIVRVLRTLRVLRIARLLRAFKSMKLIVAVIGRSAT